MYLPTVCYFRHHIRMFGFTKSGWPDTVGSRDGDRRGLRHGIPHTSFYCLSSKMGHLPVVRLTTEGVSLQAI